jgi:hypothetical protein
MFGGRSVDHGWIEMRYVVAMHIIEFDEHMELIFLWQTRRGNESERFRLFGLCRLDELVILNVLESIVDNTSF